MMLIGLDYHPSFQTIAFFIEETGEYDEQELNHSDGRAETVRDAYLTVIDPKAGHNLWTDSHAWGGLLTGANSVDERLVKKSEKQVEK